MPDDKWEILRKPNQDIVSIKYNGRAIDVSKILIGYEANETTRHPILTLQVLAHDLTFTEVPDA